MLYWTINIILGLILAPVMIGIINKVKAFFAGRKGPKLLQPWHDIVKLLHKGSVYSKTTTFWFKLAPGAVLVLTLGALLFVPSGLKQSPLGFAGDALLFLYMLGAARMLTVLAALDTGSSFEGMGASRELQFSLAAEGITILLFIFLAMASRSCEVSRMFAESGIYIINTPGLLLSAAALFIVLLTECCRVPVDDPETHLELTMIHEAMILDNSGPDLAFIHYAAALKMWIFAILLTSLLVPAVALTPLTGCITAIAGAVITAVVVGVTESIIARYRFIKIPQILFCGMCLALAAIATLVVSGGAK